MILVLKLTALSRSRAFGSSFEPSLPAGDFREPYLEQVAFGLRGRRDGFDEEISENQI
jgi:hypothetical protein